MNEDNILECLMDKTYNKDGYRQLLRDMEIAKAEIDVARSMFNNVYDDVLIEVAIYSENVARKRYDYLLRIAKSRGVNVGFDYLIEKNLKAV